MRGFAIVGTILVLAGCGATVDTRNEMLAAKVSLKTCLTQHPQDTQPCNGALAAYQADLAAYQAMSQLGMMTASATGYSSLGNAQDQPRQDGFWSIGAR